MGAGGARLGGNADVITIPILLFVLLVGYAVVTLGGLALCVYFADAEPPPVEAVEEEGQYGDG